jgi:hypothetical protein
LETPVIDFTCPKCNRHYDYAAQIAQAGGHVVNTGLKLIFVCQCGQRLLEKDVFALTPRPVNVRLERILDELDKRQR